MPKAIDLTGVRFGRLIALRKVDVSSDGQYVWLCKCDCGNKVTVKSGNLRSNHTKSCGCYMRHRISETLSTHSESHNRLYNVWSSMKARCYNPNNIHFNDYGGRGIAVCDEWKNDYQAFHDWAMSHGYDPKAKRYKCTIDRINVNGNYTPSNCRWVDMKVQRHNRRANKKGVF